MTTETKIGLVVGSLAVLITGGIVTWHVMDENERNERTSINADIAPPPRQVHEPPPPQEPDPAPEPHARPPDVAKSKCFKSAKKLVKQAKGCGIDMGDRTPDAICRELLVQEEFSDEQAVGRLANFVSNGCRTLRVARDGDRI